MFAQHKGNTNEHNFHMAPPIRRGFPAKDFRLRLYLRAKRFFRIPEASILPTYMLWLRWLLLPDARMPIDNALAKVQHDADIIWICGVPYSVELFVQFARLLPENIPFKVVRRTEHGVVVIERILTEGTNEACSKNSSHT